MSHVAISPDEMYFALRCHGKECCTCIALKLPMEAENLVITLALNDWVVWGAADGDSNPIGRMYCDSCAESILPMPMVIVARAMNRRIKDAMVTADRSSN